MKRCLNHLRDTLKEIAKTVPITQISKHTGIDRSVLEQIKNGKREVPKSAVDGLANLAGQVIGLLPRPGIDLTHVLDSAPRVSSTPRRRRGRKSDSLRDHSGPGKLSGTQEGHSAPRTQNEDE